MGIALLRGRDVQPTDDQRAAKAVVIDELLGRRFFRSRNPVGERLSAAGDTLQIVGVVNTVKQGGLSADDRPSMYVPLAQYPDYSATFVVRQTADSHAGEAVFKQAVAAVDRTVPVFNVETMSERMIQSVGMTRFASFLASLFGMIALVLGIVGIYSVLAYVVGQQRREIAVRIALGASASHVMGKVIRHACALTGTGIAIGSMVAWLLTRLLANLVVGVSPHDPRVFLGAAAMFVLLAIAAAGVPAYRTTQVSPVVALLSN